MNFSKETFDALAPFERYFETATTAKWCPYPGRDALATMHEALDAATGMKTRQDYSCGPCLLRLVKRVGFMYYADKTEREAATLAEAKGEAAAAREAAKPVKAPAKKTTAATAKKTAKK